MTWDSTNPVCRSLAQEFRLPLEDVAELARRIDIEYAADRMMVELRLIRTLQAIREGALSIQEAIAEYPGNRSAA